MKEERREFRLKTGGCWEFDLAQLQNEPNNCAADCWKLPETVWRKRWHLCGGQRVRPKVPADSSSLHTSTDVI